MLGISFAKKTVSVVRAPVVGDHGALVPDWDVAPASVVAVPLCSVQPGTGRDDSDHRDGRLVAYTVFMPTTTDVTGLDRLRFDGKDYPIIGSPLVWDQLPRLAHLQVLVGRWEDLNG